MSFAAVGYLSRMITNGIIECDMDDTRMQKNIASESAGPAAGGAKSDKLSDDPAADDKASASPREIGGRDGPDPTRYGDWEKAGRCIDF
jgi:hypothetical protein